MKFLITFSISFTTSLIAQLYKLIEHNEDLITQLSKYFRLIPSHKKITKNRNNTKTIVVHVKRRKNIRMKVRTIQWTIKTYVKPLNYSPLSPSNM